MGLLDDAIREHLELKRRRGADETEVARQEQEAFGPARRGDVAPAATATVEAEPEHEAHHEPALDEPAEFAAEEPTVLHVVPPAEEHVEHHHLAEEHTHVAEVPHNEEHPVQDEPPRPHGDPADALPHVDQPTRAFDAEEIRAATTPPPVAPEPVAPEPEPEPEPEPAPPRAEEAEEPAPEGEDVLEETPEFLQETPEHDRLWFEQRPPRDFDF
jgi:hypothetical protein